MRLVSVTVDVTTDRPTEDVDLMRAARGYSKVESAGEQQPKKQNENHRMRTKSGTGKLLSFDESYSTR